MTKIYRLIMAAGLMVCGCLFAQESWARVCFAPDENCETGATFGDAQGLDDLLDERCKEAGYTQTGCQPYELEYACPYKSSIKNCCPADYVYQTCTYPLIPAGKCGGKYKCVCDSEKYAYYQQNATTCQHVSNGNSYDNSLASGASCAYIAYDQLRKESTTNIRFTECLCDRGLYPKTEDECLSIGASVSDKKLNQCTDSNGNTYYSSCLCSDEFSKIASECEYGTYVNDKLCMQGDVYKAKRCCACNSNTYPYYGEIDEAVDSYVSCETEQGCTRGGSRYRATSCKLGYKVVSGKCEPKSCGEIIEDYLTKNNITSSALYKTGITPSATNVIVGDDTGYGAKWENFYNKKVISGQVYAQSITGSDTLVKLMKQQCSAAPLISISDSKSTSPVEFTSVELNISTSWWNEGGFTCTNCGLNIFKLYNNKYFNLKYDSAKPNGDNMYVDITGAEIKAQYTSVGYDYTLGSLGFVVTNKVAFVVTIAGKSSTQKAVMTGQKFSVLGHAALKNVDLKVSPVCVGTTCGYNDQSSGLYFNTGDVYYTSSTLWLDNSKYWLYESGNIRSLHMTTSTFIGNNTPSTTSQIQVNNGGSVMNYHTIAFSQLWAYCSDRHKGQYPYLNPTITQNGTVYTASGSFVWRNVDCGYYGQSVRDGESHSKPDDIRCKMNGNNYQYGLAGGNVSSDGCRWRQGDSSDRTPYFQFNGARGWAAN